MANFISSPNMSLPLPVIGVDPGPDYASNQNAAFTILDGHTHITGSGVPITTAAININADLSFSNFNATLLRSTRFASQAAAISGASDLNCLYFAGGNLYANDGSGNQIKITSGGNVNATSSGISSGSASAAFSSGVLIVNSASTIPANIQGGSILLGNNVASSNFLTLSPPTLSSNYTLTLPAIPAGSSFVTIDTSGNLGTASSISPSQIASNSITNAQLLNNTITAAKIANNTITNSQISTATISSGIYTPGVNAVQNCSVVMNTAAYMNVNGVVTVAGSFALTIGSAPNVLIQISLPYTLGGNFADANQGGGTAVQIYSGSGTAGFAMSAQTAATTPYVNIQGYNSFSGATFNFSYSFTYKAP
jgi:hypothetical protein